MLNPDIVHIILYSISCYISCYLLIFQSFHTVHLFKNKNFRETIFQHSFQKYLRWTPVFGQIACVKLNLCLEILSFADNDKTVKTHCNIGQCTTVLMNMIWLWWRCHSLLFDESTHQSIGHTALFSPSFCDQAGWLWLSIMTSWHSCVIMNCHLFK